jgi:hypothetical protein
MNRTPAIVLLAAGLTLLLLGLGLSGSGHASFAQLFARAPGGPFPWLALAGLAGVLAGLAGLVASSRKP